MRRSRVLLAAAAAAAVLSALVAPARSAVAAPSTCAQYEVISARGSGELDMVPERQKYTEAQQYGMGVNGYDVWSRVHKIAAAAGLTVSPYGVHYPAVAVAGSNGIPNGVGVAEGFHVGAEFDSSVGQGARDIQFHIEAVHSSCASTRFIVLGYSQGAQAAGDALQRMPSADRSLVVAGVLFGNTEFDAEDSPADRSSFDPAHNGFNGVRGTWSRILGAPVLDFCHNADLFCNLSVRHTFFHSSVYVRDFKWVYDTTKSRGLSVVGEHVNYREQGDTDKAARELAARLGLTPPAVQGAASDTVLVIDSTGSMGDEIDAVKADVKSIVERLAAGSSDYRFALVDFKDEPDQDSDYQSRVDVPFTSDTALLESGLDGISAEGGGDDAESLYSGVMSALGLPWRDGVKKDVIVVTDAPGKDPEPVTGYTRAQVTAKAFSVDPAQVYGLRVGDDIEAQSFLSDLSASTGGVVTAADASDDVVAALKSTIDQAGAAPTVAITGGSADLAGVKTTLGAAVDGDGGDPVVGYDWNLGTGTAAGEYDRTTSEPRTDVTFSAPGTYTVAVRVRTKAGLSGLATRTVAVVRPASSRPGTPMHVRAKAGDHSVALTWGPGRGPAPAYYAIRDARGRVLAAFSPVRPKASQTWTIGSLRNGKRTVLRVSALNDTGRSSGTVRVSAVPQRPKNAPALRAAGSVVRGKVLRIRGRHFRRGETVSIWIDRTTAKTMQVRVGKRGTFAAALRVPRTTSIGSHAIVASSRHAGATTTVTVGKR